MADAKTNYLENALLNHVLRGVTYTPASNLYLALLTADPGEPGALTEVSGGSYARQEITFNAAANGQASSSNAQVYGNLPAATITHVAIIDALTTGNVLYYKELPTPVQVLAGNELTFSAGNITVEEK